MKIRCVVERITYQNPENGYTILKCRVKDYAELVPVIGNLLDVNVGSVLLVEGSWKVDAKYGKQFVAESWEETLPATIYGIGFNSETNMISFPTPPKDVQDEMIAAIEQMNGKTGEVKERLHSVKDIFEFFGECEKVGGFIADEESGEHGLAFEYKGDRYMYIPNCDGPSMLSYSSENGGMGIDFFEEDEVFKKVVKKLLEESDMD